MRASAIIFSCIIQMGMSPATEGHREAHQAAAAGAEADSPEVDTPEAAEAAEAAAPGKRRCGTRPDIPMHI